MSTSLQINQEAIFSITSNGADESPRPAGFSATINPYSVAYVAAAPTGGGNLHVVGKTVGTCTLTISGHSQDGTSLPDLSLDFNLTAIPVPQATHFVAGSIAVGDQGITTPADPGTDTITGSL